MDATAVLVSPLKTHATYATRAEVLRWEGTAWAVVGTGWTVSAWPGLLVDWNGLATAALGGLFWLAVSVAWQIFRRQASVTLPVGHRVLHSRPGQRRKSRTYIIGTVLADALVITASGVLWCVAARQFGWSETVTGANLQVAAGLSFLCWGLLHIPAVRHVAGTPQDLPVASRRVLGTGPMTVQP
jgi:hypothetical protein